MVVVTKKPGESDDKLIARFRKKVLESGLIPEARERSQFVSDSEKRKQKKYRIKHLRDLQRKRNH